MATPDEVEVRRASRRGWLQFRLRKLVGLITLGGVGFGEYRRRFIFVGSDHPIADIVANTQTGPLDEMIDLIQQTVEPSEWEDAGGPGCIRLVASGTALRVWQRPPLQKQVAEVVDQIRVAGGVGPRLANAGLLLPV